MAKEVSDTSNEKTKAVPPVSQVDSSKPVGAGHATPQVVNGVTQRTSSSIAGWIDRGAKSL